MPDNEKNYLDITTTAGWLGWLNKKNSRKRVFSQDERVYLATNFYRWKHGADAHGSRKPIEEEICNGYFTKFPKPPFVQEGSYLGAEWEEKNKTQRCKQIRTWYQNEHTTLDALGEAVVTLDLDTSGTLAMEDKQTRLMTPAQAYVKLHNTEVMPGIKDRFAQHLAEDSSRTHQNSWLSFLTRESTRLYGDVTDVDIRRKCDFLAEHGHEEGQPAPVTGPQTPEDYLQNIVKLRATAIKWANRMKRMTRFEVSIFMSGPVPGDGSGTVMSFNVSTTNEWLQKMGENHRQTNITEPMESHVRENEAELLKTYSVSMTEAERRKLEESCQGLGSEEDDEDTPGVSTTLPEQEDRGQGLGGSEQASVLILRVPNTTDDIIKDLGGGNKQILDDQLSKDKDDGSDDGEGEINRSKERPTVRKYTAQREEQIKANWALLKEIIGDSANNIQKTVKPKRKRKAAASSQDGAPTTSIAGPIERRQTRGATATTAAAAQTKPTTPPPTSAPSSPTPHTTIASEPLTPAAVTAAASSLPVATDPGANVTSTTVNTPALPVTITEPAPARSDNESVQKPAATPSSVLEGRPVNNLTTPEASTAPAVTTTADVLVNTSTSPTDDTTAMLVDSPAPALVHATATPNVDTAAESGAARSSTAQALASNSAENSAPTPAASETPTTVAAEAQAPAAAETPAPETVEAPVPATSEMPAVSANIESGNAQPAGSESVSHAATEQPENPSSEAGDLDSSLVAPPTQPLNRKRKRRTATPPPITDRATRAHKSKEQDLAKQATIREEFQRTAVDDAELDNSNRLPRKGADAFHYLKIAQVPPALQQSWKLLLVCALRIEEIREWPAFSPSKNATNAPTPINLWRREQGRKATWMPETKLPAFAPQWSKWFQGFDVQEQEPMIGELFTGGMGTLFDAMFFLKWWSEALTDLNQEHPADLQALEKGMDDLLQIMRGVVCPDSLEQAKEVEDDRAAKRQRVEDVALYT